MSLTRARNMVRTEPFAYEDFQGLDSSRDVRSQDTGSDQHLAVIDNAYCDWRGQIVRDPPARYLHGERTVVHVRHFGPKEAVYVERSEAGLSFLSERDHSLENVHPPNAVVTSTVFDQQVQIACYGRAFYSYDGVQFRRNMSPALNAMMPAFVTSTQRRMAVAGIPGCETEVHLSRVDRADIWPDDEDEDSENVLRAGKIDIANLLGTADRITGLGSFEQSRLVIFTADRAIVYRIDPDLTRWNIDENANIHIGCASHNTIVNAGTDLIFCSRSGIHSIRRSEDNGILVFSMPLSEKVDLLYRQLFESVPNPQEISAVFDQDMTQYHIFFPQPGGINCKRLTLSLNPEGGEPQLKFSTGTFLNARCGASLAGQLVFGTSGGIYELIRMNGQGIMDDIPAPNLEIVTPYLWHGSVIETKQTHALIIQASGQGLLEIDAWDDTGRGLGSITVEISEDRTDDNSPRGVPLSRQYERPWSHRYRGAQYRIRSRGGSDLLRIVGFAVVVRTED